MRLTRHTDLAFRVLLQLGVNPGQAIPVSEIARAHDASHNHLVKVVNGLAKGGYVTTLRGRSGGVMLARPVESIGLGEVVRACEPDMRLIDCAGCNIARSCALPRPLHEATRAFVAVLDRYSLADIIASSHGLDQLLGLKPQRAA